jgi:hypothetical protein
MNNKFDELTKSLAQSVTRRQALKRFGVGLAGMALACFGLANKAEAGAPGVGHYKQCVEACLDRGISLLYCESLCFQLPAGHAQRATALSGTPPPATQSL